MAGPLPLDEVVRRERESLPPPLFEIPSMLSYEERALLHWAAREGRHRDGGQIVDAGAFLGGSSLALGLGLRQSGLAGEGGATKIHSFDFFRVGEERERVYFADGFDFAIGRSTLDVYRANIAPVDELVQIYAGDIHGFRWHGAPISTLFIDVAKSWDTHDHVVAEFFPSLAPDALVIQQDLVHFGHPWCAIAMELLCDQLEYLGHVPYGSAVYRVTGAIGPDDLPTSLRQRLDLAEALALVDRCADRVGEPYAGQLRLAGAMVLATYGELEQGRARISEVEASYGDDRVPHISEGFANLRAWIDSLERPAVSLD